MLAKNIKSIFDLDTLFNDNEIFKDFIIEIFETTQEIINETEQKFGIIFAKISRNEYLVMDYKILILALLRFLQKIDIEINYIQNEFCKNSKDSILSLLFILSRKNLIYFSNLEKYYTKYKLCVTDDSYNYIMKFNGIALKYPIILKLFSNNKEMIYEFEKLITRDFIKYEDRDKSKECLFFSAENFSQFNDYFHNNY